MEKSIDLLGLGGFALFYLESQRLLNGVNQSKTGSTSGAGLNVTALEVPISTQKLTEVFF